MKYIVDMPDKFDGKCCNCNIPNCGGLIPSWEKCPISDAKKAFEVNGRIEYQGVPVGIPRKLFYVEE